MFEKVVNKKYDLIFLDHMMPGMDGIETLHAFPEQEGNVNLETPVIALTANAVNGAKEMFLQNGFDDFLQNQSCTPNWKNYCRNISRRIRL